MKYKLYAVATALAFFSKSKELKEQRAKKKDFGFFGFLRKKPLMRRLPQPPVHKAGASGFAMTGLVEGFYKLKAKGLKLKADQNSRTLKQSHATRSAGPVKRRLKQKAKSLRLKADLKIADDPKSTAHSLSSNSALIIAPQMNKVKALASLAISAAESFWLLFEEKSNKPTRRRMRRHHHNSNKQTSSIINNQKPNIVTTPFNSPASGGHWTQTCIVEMWRQLKLDGKSRKKAFTPRLQKPPLQKATASGFAMTGKRRGIAVKIRPNILMLLLIVVVTIGAKRTKAQARALQIGDAIPEAVWDTPLQVVNHPEGKNSITLNDYKGKLIILDFWATSCGACIAKMPEMEQLNQSFEQQAFVLPISYQPAEKVQAFMRHSPIMQKLHTTSIVEDTLLAKLFPHHYLPHEVWIDAQGKVLAISESEYVNAANISKALQGTLNTKGTTKADLLFFDKGKAMFAQEANYYQQVAPYLAGLRYTSGTATDSIKGCKRYYVVNAPVLQLYALALASEGLPLNPKRRILEVQQKQNYVYSKAQGYYLEWQQKHSYCYETVMPLNTTIKERKQQFLLALNSYFNCTGRIEKRWVGCWIIKTSTTPIKAEELQKEAVKSITLANFIQQLNQQPNLPYVLNETQNLSKTIQPPLKKEMNAAAIAATLAKQGLALKQEKRYLDFFVLTENKPNHTHP